MQPFQTMLDSVPTTLAFQDALSNSVGNGAAAPGTTTAPGTAPAGPPQQPASQNPLGSFGPLIILAMVFVIGFSWLTNRKEKKRREQLLAQIKKGERVLTIGGIIGTITDVRDDEVILKIDESSNVKMRFTRSSIQQVLKSVPNGESTGDSGGAKGGAGAAGGTAGQIEVKAGRNAKVAT